MNMIMLVIDFIIISISGIFIYSSQIKQYFTKPLRYYIEIILIAASITILLTIINNKNINNIIVFFIVLVFLPYIRVSQNNSKQNEKVFADVIHYCTYMSVELKHAPNVTYAINKCCAGMQSDFASSLLDITNYFDKDKTIAKEKMDDLAAKYNYSIIKQLSIIILQLQYENDKSSSNLIDVFQSDLECLNRAVKENQKKRRALRIQYIGLNIGSMIALFILSKQLFCSLNIQNNEVLENIVLLYYALTIISFFIAELYFNNNTTKE